MNVYSVQMRHEAIACVVWGVDRPILFMSTNRFKGIQNRLLREVLGMCVVLRGSLMRFKMSWYGCGLKREFDEIQNELV